MTAVLPAASVEDIRRRVSSVGRERPAADRLVSVVFANPGSPVWRDLQTNRAFLDERSGNDWDLFFAGLSAFGRTEESADEIAAPNRHRDFPAFHNPRSFGQIERWVTLGHDSALAASAAEGTPWRYRGGTDIVSFMMYGQDPDWSSLKAVPLYTEGGDLLTLVHVTEGLARWKSDNVDPLLAPGEVLGAASTPTGWLIAGLGWTASAVAGGVLGDSVYDLIRALL